MDIASLEAEAMLTGKWKNFAELEEDLSLEELNLIIKASREAEHRHNKFMAALKGINIDEGDEAVDKVEQIKKKIAAKQQGMTEEEMELKELGIEIERD